MDYEIFHEDYFPSTHDEWRDWILDMNWAEAKEDGYVSPALGGSDFISPKMADSIPAWKLAIAERIQESES